MICPKCQYEQHEASECVRCGLIFERYRADPEPQAPPPAHKTKEPFKPASPARPAWRLSFKTIRLLFLIPSCVVLLLLLWPERNPPSEPDPEAPVRMHRKMELTREIVGKGEPHQLRLDEWEVNSWLDENLTQAMSDTQAQMEEEWATQGTVEGVVVTFEEDRIQIHLQFEVLSKDMSLTLWGHVKTVDGYLRLDVDSGRMGQLPLPRAVLQKAMSNVFDSPENQEKFQLPPGIGGIEIENGQLVVDYLASAAEQSL